jgi:hypothetical protein
MAPGFAAIAGAGLMYFGRELRRAAPMAIENGAEVINISVRHLLSASQPVSSSPAEAEHGNASS